MIDKNTDNSTQEINPFPIKRRSIQRNFYGDRLSSDGGLFLHIMPGN